MLNESLALQAVIGLAILLILLFLSLLGYTYWTRKSKEYWQSYEQKFRDYFFPLLFDYSEKKKEERDPNDLIKKISQRTEDYSFFIKLLDDFNDILDGEQRNNLNDLIRHPVFLSFYTKKLFQSSKDSIIFACTYFQKTGNIDDRILAKLILISKSDDLKLAYTATKALQSAMDISIRKSALLRFLRRDDITDLMISELLHIFDTGTIEERPKVAKGLKEILLSDVGFASKVIIVRYIGNQNFYESSIYLFQFLKRIQYNQNKAQLIQNLITTLGQLQSVESEPIIRNYISNKNIDTATQIAAVKALSTLGGVENSKYLAKQLLKVEFPVRKAIIQELILYSNEGIEYLQQFVIVNLHFVRQFQQQEHPPRELKEIIKKIEDIALGIRITLILRLTNTYV